MQKLSTKAVVTLLLIMGIVVGGIKIWQAKTEWGRHATNISLVTTEDKANWIRSQVYAFNNQNDGKYHVSLIYLDSRAAMQDILAGKQKPVLWSPDNPMWVERLSAVWNARHGTPLVDIDDASAFRVFLRSPVVFLTTQNKAAYLRSRLGQPGTWENLRELSLRREDPPWGHVRFSHADPLTSNSGMLTIAMILNEYGRDHGSAGNLENTARSSSFARYLEQMEHGLVYSKDSRLGSYAISQSYIKAPSSLDFITTYESEALSAAERNKQFAVIYPNPTVVSQQSMSILSAPWVSSEQHAGASAFMNYVHRESAMKSGLKYNMRSDDQSGGESLTPKLRKFSSQGFQETYVAEDLPPYDALNMAAFQWLTHIVHHQ